MKPADVIHQQNNDESTLRSEEEPTSATKSTSKNRDNGKEKDVDQSKLETTDNIAVTTFTKSDHDERQFDMWYGPETIKYLIHSSPSSAKCLHVVFDDHQDEQKGFKEQLQQLIVLANKLNRPALFISKEPGCPNHWLCGMTMGNEVVIVNPIGLTKHHDFYATLQALEAEQTIEKVFLSDLKLQHDPEGYVSCGPICVELLMHWSSLEDIKTKLFDQIKTGKKESKQKLGYTLVDIASKLPSMLQTLSGLNSEAYQACLRQLRANHLAHLKTISSLQQPQTQQVINEYWESCLHSSEQVLIRLLLLDDKINILNIDNNSYYQILKNRLNKAYNVASKTTEACQKKSKEKIINVSTQSGIDIFNSTATDGLLPHPTKGEGDCAFHAVFGRWNPTEGQFVCTDVENKRHQLAEAIRCCQPENSLFPLIQNAIMNLILEGRHVEGKRIQAAQQEYQKLSKANDEAITEAWRKFEKKINKYPDIIAYVGKYFGDYIDNYTERKGHAIDLSVLNHLNCSFREQFNTCLNEDDDLLRHLIFSIPDLRSAYIRYEQSSVNIDWNTILSNQVIINEYANFIARLGTWLLPMELQLIAKVFQIAIKLRQRNIEPCTYVFGHAKKSTDVYFNGINHYERLVYSEDSNVLESEDNTNYQALKNSLSKEHNIELETTEAALYKDRKEKIDVSTQLKPDSFAYDSRVDNFFKDIVSYCKETFPSKFENLVFIVVGHMVPTLPYFLRALKCYGTIRAVIPKSSHRDKKIYEQIRLHYNVTETVTKEALRDEKFVRKYLDVTLHPNDHCVIIDIGGYFSHLKSHERVIGIVEDTQNGHIKYESQIADILLPVMSVARSTIKATEDYCVGKAIIRATDSLLRTTVGKTIEEVGRPRGRSIGVMGFGKIGSSAAEHLKQIVSCAILVHDRDPVVSMHASSKGYTTVSKQDLLKHCSLIICATGNGSLGYDDLVNLRDDVFIASCTSGDDEFGEGLVKLREKHSYNLRDYIEQFYVLTSSGKEKRINLLHRGNAINFVFNAVIGPHIYAVQGLLLMCAAMLANRQVQRAQKVIELTKDEQVPVAALWNKHFEGDSAVEFMPKTEVVLTTATNTNERLDLNPMSVSLQHYYSTIWHDLPGLMFQSPQPIDECYVHLALVEQPEQDEKEKSLAQRERRGGQSQENENTSSIPNMSLRDARLHSYEDIYKPTKPINVEDIFTPNEKTLNKAINKLLIVGRAGVGKSILCQHIAYCWATQDLFAERYKMVFWLKLKHLNQTHFLSQKSLTLAEVIQMDWQSHQADKPVPSKESIQRSLDADNTLLILDGFDEVAHLYGEPNPLGGVLKAALRYKHLILTSRPYGVPRDIQFDRTLENLGFNDEQIMRYVTNMVKQYKPQDKTIAKQAAKTFRDQLKNNTNIWGIAHIPLNLNFLCHLRFDQEAHFDFNHDTTLTRLYSKMTELLLRHYAKEKKHEKNSSKLSVKELQNLCDHELRLLERLAFEGLLSGHLLIPSEKVDQVNRKVAMLLSKDAHSQITEHALLDLTLETGFLKGVGDSRNNANRSYYFIHLTFQEYLAAHYLVRGLNQRDTGGEYFQSVLSFIETEKYRPEYRMLFRFAAGLLSREYVEGQNHPRQVEAEYSSEAVEGPSEIKTTVPLSNALCYFWDAIVCSPQDLIGIQKIDLWMSCLEEVKKPGTKQFDARIIYQEFLFNELEEWVTKSIYIISGQTLFLCFFCNERPDLHTNFYDLSWQIALAHKSLWGKLKLFSRVTEGLNGEKKHVRYKALRELLALCQVSSSEVLADQTLVVGLRANLRDQDRDVSITAHEVVGALCRNVPCAVLADQALMDVMHDELSKQNSRLRSLALAALIPLCQANPCVMLADQTLMDVIHDELSKQNSGLRRLALAALIPLYQANPCVMLADQALMDVMHDELSKQNSGLRSFALAALIPLCQANPCVMLADQSLMTALHNGLRNRNNRLRDTVRKVLIALCKTSPRAVLEDKTFIVDLCASLNYKAWLVCETGLRAVLRDKAWLVRKDAQQVFAVLCKRSSLVVLENETLMASLRAGLCDVEAPVCCAALHALGYLCQGRPREVLADEALMTCLQAGLCDAEVSVRCAALQALAALCQRTPCEVLAYKDLMTILQTGLYDDQWSVRMYTQQALAALCQVAPHEVFADMALIASLQAGLCDDDSSVRIAILNALRVLCQGRACELLVDEALMAGLKAGLGDVEAPVRCAALQALANTCCKVSPREVLADQTLIAALMMCLCDEESSVRTVAMRALGVLCQSSPREVLADEELMAGLIDGLWDTENSRSGAAFEALEALCQSNPCEVIKKEDLLARLRVGLFGYGHNNGWFAGNARHKASQKAITQLGTSITAADLLRTGHNIIVMFLDWYFHSPYPACIVITQTDIILQVKQQRPTREQITTENREAVELIVKICRNRVQRLGLPLNVFKALSENRSIVPRMLARPLPRNVRAGFFEEHQQHIAQHGKGRNQYSLASQNMRDPQETRCLMM